MESIALLVKIASAMADNQVYKLQNIIYYITLLFTLLGLTLLEAVLTILCDPYLIEIVFDFVSLT